MSLFFSVMTGLAAATVQAQTIVLGVPGFDANLNVLSSDHPAAVFIRTATLETLVNPEGNIRRLGLSESMSIAPDGKVLSFRPGPNARFSTGKRVLARDIAFSLNRCLAAKKLDGVAAVSERFQPLPGKSTAAVEVELAAPIKGANQRIPPSLSSCPILDERSSLLFGQELGRGGNFLASGDYKITAFNLGKEYTLVRINDYLRESAQSFTIRGLDDPAHALAALRAGTLDAMLTNSAAEIEKARTDPTLSLSQCLNHTVIKRHNLEFPCNPGLSPEAIKYSA